MAYPEPSLHDCGAPWNEEDAVDEDGEEITVCGCSSCQAARRKAARDEAAIDDYEDRKRGW